MVKVQKVWPEGGRTEKYKIIEFQLQSILFDQI